MARRDFRRGAAAIRQKRLSTWFFASPVGVTLTATGGTITHQLNAAALALRPFTVIRSHLEIYVESDQEAASEQYIGAVGMCVVSEQASAIGVTAVPTPIIDLGSEYWFLHQMYMGSCNLQAAGIINDNPDRLSVDSKAMRKVNESEDLLIVAEFSGIGSGQSVLIAGRFLVKLH